MEHKVKTVKMLERHKIHPKAQAWMNILLYRMISMLVVRSTFKIDVFKMEHAFQMGYQKGDKIFHFSPTNWQGEEAFVVD
jgi:hypothetical protein